MTEEKKTILLVDDEPKILEVMADELCQYNIVTASSGEEGFKKVLEKKPDLIISDIMMPEMDGLAFLELVRGQGLRTPVIFATGFGDLEKIRKAWKLGAFDFLSKPVDFEVLQSTVRNALLFGLNFDSGITLKTVIPMPTVSLQANLRQDVAQKLTAFCNVNKVTIESCLEKLIEDHL